MSRRPIAMPMARLSRKGQNNQNIKIEIVANYPSVTLQSGIDALPVGS
jgi:hypothetical protein